MYFPRFFFTNFKIFISIAPKKTNIDILTDKFATDSYRKKFGQNYNNTHRASGLQIYYKTDSDNDVFL